VSTSKHLPPTPIRPAPAPGAGPSDCGPGTTLPPTLSKALATLAGLLGEQAAGELMQSDPIPKTEDQAP